MSGSRAAFLFALTLAAALPSGIYPVPLTDPPSGDVMVGNNVGDRLSEAYNNNEPAGLSETNHSSSLASIQYSIRKNVENVTVPSAAAAPQNNIDKRLTATTLATQSTTMGSPTTSTPATLKSKAEPSKDPERINLVGAVEADSTTTQHMAATVASGNTTEVSLTATTAAPDKNHTELSSATAVLTGIAMEHEATNETNESTTSDSSTTTAAPEAMSMDVSELTGKSNESITSGSSTTTAAPEEMSTDVSEFTGKTSENITSHSSTATATSEEMSTERSEIAEELKEITVNTSAATAPPDNTTVEYSVTPVPESDAMESSTTAADPESSSMESSTTTVITKTNATGPSTNTASSQEMSVVFSVTTASTDVPENATVEPIPVTAVIHDEILFQDLTTITAGTKSATIDSAVPVEIVTKSSKTTEFLANATSRPTTTAGEPEDDTSKPSATAEFPANNQSIPINTNSTNQSVTISAPKVAGSVPKLSGSSWSCLCIIMISSVLKYIASIAS